MPSIRYAWQVTAFSHSQTVLVQSVLMTACSKKQRQDKINASHYVLKKFFLRNFSKLCTWSLSSLVTRVLRRSLETGSFQDALPLSLPFALNATDTEHTWDTLITFSTLVSCAKDASELRTLQRQYRPRLMYHHRIIQIRKPQNSRYRMSWKHGCRSSDCQVVAAVLQQGKIIDYYCRAMAISKLKLWNAFYERETQICNGPMVCYKLCKSQWTI